MTLQVSQRLCEVLLQFPSGVHGGVSWSVLNRAYEERNGCKLVSCHSSPLVASHTLLWDILRLVNKESLENPVVAVDDQIALTPLPGCMATWPSLYSCLCEVVGAKGAEGLPLSQVALLLEHRWHSSFDEGALTYLTDSGSVAEIDGLSGLIPLLLQWRQQRLDWQLASGFKGATMQAALDPVLEVLPGDVPLLRCRPKAIETVMSVSHEPRVVFAAPLPSSLRQVSKSQSFASLVDKTMPRRTKSSRCVVTWDPLENTNAEKDVPEQRAIPQGIVQRLRAQIEKK